MSIEYNMVNIKCKYCKAFIPCVLKAAKQGFKCLMEDNEEYMNNLEIMVELNKE